MNSSQNNNFKDINKHISHTWDMNIHVRATDIENGTDYTYNKIIVPWVMKQIEKYKTINNSIIDIGCGCGFLTSLISNEKIGKVTGVDISKNSISYAKNKYSNIKFILGDFCNLYFDEKFNIGISIMTLNNMPDMKLFFESAFKVLQENGKLIIVIPHPCFWPIKHLKKHFFSYLDEKNYEIKFSTKGRDDYPSPILYFHRSIETYCKYIKDAHFNINIIEELKEKNPKEYPDILGFVIEKQ